MLMMKQERTSFEKKTLHLKPIASSLHVLLVWNLPKRGHVCRHYNIERSFGCGGFTSENVGGIKYVNGSRIK